MIKFSISGLLVIVVVCGCASDGRMREAFGHEPVIHYNRLNVVSFTGRVQRFPTPPQRPYGTVKVFETRDDVKQPFDLIGMMSCEGEAKEEAEIIRAMLYRAADMGADGIILIRPVALSSRAEQVTSISGSARTGVFGRRLSSSRPRRKKRSSSEPARFLTISRRLGTNAPRLTIPDCR